MQGSNHTSSPDNRLLKLRDVALKLISPPPKVYVEESFEAQPKVKKQSVFFNDGFAISSFKRISNSLEEVGFEVKKKKAIPGQIKAPLTPKRDLDLRGLAAPPPGFLSAPKKMESKQYDLSTDSSSGSGVHAPSIQNFDIGLLSSAITAPTPILEELPNKSLHKRYERCTYEGETVIGINKGAALKFYNLKKRFGFLTLSDDGSEVFFCEDDILVAGQPLKVFKEAVLKKKSIAALCSVIRYTSEGEEKLKATNIEFTISD
eukprot:CAMPEP_0204903956 /NCGR_PEP_ID=MMETSP1397-20131031/4580_1 /ASSEMBLY_ACC=CAM_ASM_000891 /TAXON_ID=49980 /ORGANISM="Climacostomum Climacostomum virens, Strain Stock W-24" /LENGTH=260 /DNA_ID=CAMNT_0052072673 /DNA_START=175 /DNA_END=957 /DNA_ORIENTATION=+